MKPEISIIMPAIRTDNWIKVYESIQNSTSRNFELIIGSPYDLPAELRGYKNIKIVKDWGSPTRASQIASMLIEGKYVFPTYSDDSIFIKNAIDENLNLLISLGECIKNAVVCKYSESQNYSAPTRYQDDDYYKLINAYKTNPEIVNKDWWIYNTVFMHSEYFLNMGGFDCSFQACPYSHADLAIRCQSDGANAVMSNHPIIMCDHNQSDHMPIEISQIYEDAPVFNHKYSKEIDKTKNKIDLMNWRSAPSVWKHRFA
jgi:glycosyltransferase involved in cell wall biosynthesis